MITFDHVTKIYANGTTALKDVSLQISKGEFVFVVGASGAGKSTFLKLMMREEVPSQGIITVNKTVLNTLSHRAVPYFRRGLGVVFQDFRLIPAMTVYDNIAFAMRVTGTREKEIRQRVPYVISLVGLVSKARCLPAELSGGEQQRVALARALANNAEILIADEPTGNVDPQMSFEIVELLTRLNEKGTTVIMVTHAHGLVKQFDRRVVVLENGAVVSDGSPLYGELEESSRSHLNEFSISGAKPEEEAPSAQIPAQEEAALSGPSPAADAEETPQDADSPDEKKADEPVSSAEVPENKLDKPIFSAEIQALFERADRVLEETYALQLDEKTEEKSEEAKEPTQD